MFWPYCRLPVVYTAIPVSLEFTVLSIYARTNLIVYRVKADRRSPGQSHTMSADFMGSKTERHILWLHLNCHLL